MYLLTYHPKSPTPWNKGKIIGQKAPLKLREIWAIRIRLQMAHRLRDLALFNLAIDSKLRGCDLVTLEVNDVCVGGRMRTRTTIIQSKTGRPVQFELTDQTRTSAQEWLEVRPDAADRFAGPRASRRLG